MLDSDRVRPLDKMMSTSLLDRMFVDGRTLFAWAQLEVPEILLREAYALAKMGPTASNISPMRIVFVATKAGKERLRPALAEGNIQKTMSAPVTAILGYDTRFPDHLPRLFPHNPAPKAFYEANPEISARAGFRNATLQAAYFLLAARAVGLDCGPMSGFDHDLVDAEFFPGGTVKSNFLMNLGFGDRSTLFPRGPRFDFDEVCRII